MIFHGIINVLPAEKRKQIKLYALFVFFVCLLLSIQLFFYFFIYVFEIGKVFSFDRFQKVEIQIIREPVVKKEIIMRGTDFYYIDIEYQYEFSGRQFKSNRVSFRNMSPENVYNSKHKNEMESIKNYILEKRDAFVDPKNPEYSVLIPKDIYKKTRAVNNKWYALDIGMICGSIASFIVFCLVTYIENAYQTRGKKLNEYLLLLPIVGVFFFVSICIFLIVD